MEGREATRLASSESPVMMIGSDTYGSTFQNSSVATPPQGGVVQQTRIPFSSVVTSASKPPESASPYRGDSSTPTIFHGMNLSEPLKKKRGRPRKYGPDGTMALALSPLSSVPSYSTPSFKRNRGRPPGSGKRQQLDALGCAGIGFTPHVITVKAGEDVAAKIMSFSQQGPRAICIISANGAISNVTLRQPATSGGTVTYEGRFEIISLSGSFLLTDSGGTRSRTGGLSVSLAGPDGRVLGGGVAGLLIAATPIQLVVGSFISEGKKPRPRPPPLNHEPSSATPQVSNLGAGAAASPPSRGTMSESSGGAGSPLNQSVSTSNTSQPVQTMPAFSATGWPASQSSAGDHRHEGSM
ncbi:AT-hook motif nuclear-localized protein 10-like isoform X2 [Nymphaea colorata]|uniref:AT-hook motif nuclear-localized protein 10-like isoform X2 n=1 Tax=Nymphaea colorata TaxID=210225 RepID=UPI00129DEE1B|nr:AT-hook motif nuclear-localized protein 10-like isoform X2 [Nymphaea colorata]